MVDGCPFASQAPLKTSSQVITSSNNSMINQNAPAISQRIQDWSRIEEIAKELGEIIQREQKRHIMDQMFLGFEENLQEAKELLLGIVDYDPTPQYSPHLQ